MLETILASTSTSTLVGLGSLFAHNVIPQKWQFWARDDNNLGKLFGDFLRKIARDLAEDGELDGDFADDS